MGRIFQGIREVIDEDEEQNWAQDTALGYSSLDRQREWEDPVKIYMLNVGVEVSGPWEEVALDAI